MYQPSFSCIFCVCFCVILVVFSRYGTSQEIGWDHLQYDLVYVKWDVKS